MVTVNNIKDMVERCHSKKKRQHSWGTWIPFLKLTALLLFIKLLINELIDFVKVTGIFEKGNNIGII